MSMRAFAGLMLAVVATIPGCRPADSGSKSSPVVATIGGVSIPLSSFENYLAVHFVEEGLEEPLAQDDRNRVLSRLFDDFVVESLLVVEADRRGVKVPDAEVAAWLGGDADPDPAREKARREQARRELATRRLLDAWLRAESKARGDDVSEDSRAGDASGRLADTLRARYVLKLHPEVLPFRYVAEIPMPPKAADRPASRGPR